MLVDGIMLNMVSDPNPFKVIESCITQLDSEMTSHQKKCKPCKNKGTCDSWIDMIETWNFYHIAMVRAQHNTFKLPPNYEE